MPVANQTLTLQLSLLLVHVLVVNLLHALLYVEIYRASKCYESALFQDAGSILTHRSYSSAFTIDLWPAYCSVTDGLTTGKDIHLEKAFAGIAIIFKNNLNIILLHTQAINQGPHSMYMCYIQLHTRYTQRCDRAQS